MPGKAPIGVFLSSNAQDFIEDHGIAEEDDMLPHS